MYRQWRIEVWERDKPSEPARVDHVRTFVDENDAIAYKNKINESIDPNNWHMFATGPFKRDLEFIQ